MNKYFVKDEKSNCTIFTGNICKCYIPKRYEAHDLLSQTDTINTIGVFHMEIDGKVSLGLLLTAMISMSPSDTYNETIDEDLYLVVELRKGDKIMVTNDIVRNDKLAYVLWVEFIALGRLPKFITYENIPWLFDKIAEVCDINFGINHVIFETLYSHLFRDDKDIFKKYRHTDMKRPPIFIGIRNVAYGPDDTMSKLLGSYSNASLNSALINKSDQASAIELQLRA